MYAHVPVVRQPRRLDVVVETAPLVVGNDEGGAVPEQALHDGLRHEGQERLPTVDIGMRVVVIAAALVLAEEERVQIAVRRQLAAGRLGEELADRAGDVEVLLAPEGQERHIAEVVLVADALAFRLSQRVGKVLVVLVLLIRSVGAACV